MSVLTDSSKGPVAQFTDEKEDEDEDNNNDKKMQKKKNVKKISNIIFLRETILVKFGFVIVIKKQWCCSVLPTGFARSYVTLAEDILNPEVLANYCLVWKKQQFSRIVRILPSGGLHWEGSAKNGVPRLVFVSMLLSAHLKRLSGLLYTHNKCIQEKIHIWSC